jgi:glutathione peroxidase
MSIYQYTVKDAHGNEKQLSDYAGKLLLVVNTASKCGHTPQYEGLQKLYENLQPKGVEVLAFPCDQFGHQEPGTDEEIQQFCAINYHVTFPVFAKIEVNGASAHPLYQYLTSETGSDIGWNFTKFIIDRKGNLVKRYEPSVKPEELVPDLEKIA